MIRRLFPWTPAALWAAVLFFLSSRSWGSAPSTIPVDDFVIHFGLYFVFGLLLALGRRWVVDPPSLLGVFIIGLLYALSDEVHQLFVPGRTFDPMDLLADGLGVLIGLGTVHRWTRPDVPADRSGRSPRDDASSRATA